MSTSAFFNYSSKYSQASSSDPKRRACYISKKFLFSQIYT